METQRVFLVIFEEYDGYGKCTGNMILTRPCDSKLNVLMIKDFTDKIREVIGNDGVVITNIIELEN